MLLPPVAKIPTKNQGCRHPAPAGGAAQALLQLLCLFQRLQAMVADLLWGQVGWGGGFGGRWRGRRQAGAGGVGLVKGIPAASGACSRQAPSQHTRWRLTVTATCWPFQVPWYVRPSAQRPTTAPSSRPCIGSDTTKVGSCAVGYVVGMGADGHFLRGAGARPGSTQQTGRTDGQRQTCSATQGSCCGSSHLVGGGKGGTRCAWRRSLGSGRRRRRRVVVAAGLGVEAVQAAAHAETGRGWAVEVCGRRGCPCERPRATHTAAAGCRAARGFPSLAGPVGHLGVGKGRRRGVGARYPAVRGPPLVTTRPEGAGARESAPARPEPTCRPPWRAFKLRQARNRARRSAGFGPCQ